LKPRPATRTGLLVIPTSDRTLPCRIRVAATQASVSLRKYSSMYPRHSSIKHISIIHVPFKNDEASAKIIILLEEYNVIRLRSGMVQTCRKYATCHLTSQEHPVWSKSLVSRPSPGKGEFYLVRQKSQMTETPVESSKPTSRTYLTAVICHTLHIRY
jgi:hypothetical protein